MAVIASLVRYICKPIGLHVDTPRTCIYINSHAFTHTHTHTYTGNRAERIDAAVQLSQMAEMGGKYLVSDVHRHVSDSTLDPPFQFLTKPLASPLLI